MFYYFGLWRQDGLDQRIQELLRLPGTGEGPPIRGPVSGDHLHPVHSRGRQCNLVFEALVHQGLLQAHPAPLGETDVVTQVRNRYLGPDRRAGSGTYSHPAERHQDVLARSPFPHIETAHWDRLHTRTLDEVVGYQFSLSYSSPAQLGPDKDAFEHDLRQALTQFQPDGRFDELIRTEAIIATRPDRTPADRTND